MWKRRGLRFGVFDAVNALCLALLCVATLYPLVYVVSLSVSDSLHVGRGQVVLWPIGFQLRRYMALLRSANILRAYYNTVLYTLVGTVFSVAVASLAAYPLSISRLAGRRFLAVAFVITIYVSGGMIPSYLVIHRLRMINTMWAIVLPPAFSAWNVLLALSYFRTIPDALREAAYLDGASEWAILTRVVLPLSKPILATIGLFSAVNIWNSYMSPLIYLNDPAKYPLQVVLRGIVLAKLTGSLGQAFVNPGEFESGVLISLRMAAVVLSMGPIILLYPLAQRYFTKGVLIGSIKG